MKRTQKTQSQKKGRWGGEAITITRDQLQSRINVIQAVIDELQGVVKRMAEAGPESVTIPGGSGAKSYELAEKAIKAWKGGVSDALLDAILHAPDQR